MWSWATAHFETAHGGARASAGAAQIRVRSFFDITHSGYCEPKSPRTSVKKSWHVEKHKQVGGKTSETVADKDIEGENPEQQGDVANAVAKKTHCLLRLGVTRQRDCAADKERTEQCR